jgi:hypothetical protein
MKSKPAPILLFVYNRLDCVISTVEHLKANHLAKVSDLFIYSDASKNDEDFVKVNEVRSFIRKIDGFKSVKIVEAKINQGLANSVIRGVSCILTLNKKVIVLEDDIVTSPVFLNYMNDALDFYESDQRIWSISGYHPPIHLPKAYSNSIYLSYRACSWGWASWRNRWETIDWEIKDYQYYKTNPFRILHFCKGGTDLDKMLRFQMEGKIDSWAIRWCYNQSMQNKYTIYPTKSFVNNIGIDGHGTHCDPSSARFSQKIVKDFPYTLKANIKFNKTIARKFKKFYDRSIIRRMKKILSPLHISSGAVLKIM